VPERVTAHLDRSYDSAMTRILLDEFGFTGAIARKGMPAPVQAGKRWVVERAHAWMNGYGKLRRCTERNARLSTSTCTWRPRPSSSAGSSSKLGPDTAGTPAPPPNASSDTYCRAL